MGFEPLRVTAEGRMTVHDGRLHVGEVALSALVDSLPCKYRGPADFDYGKARITVELMDPPALREGVA
jgi:hypothetical protein